MTVDELRDKLREIRGDRRIRKVSAKKRKAEVKVAVKSKDRLQKALGELPIEQQIALLESLEAHNEGG